jgi:hypothetical protein
MAPATVGRWARLSHPQYFHHGSYIARARRVRLGMRYARVPPLITEPLAFGTIAQACRYMESSAQLDWRIHMSMCKPEYH